MKIGNVINNSSASVYSNYNTRSEYNSEVKSSPNVDEQPLDIPAIKGADGVEEDSLSDDVLDKAVKQANQTLKMFDRKIERTVHEVTKVVIYTLRDTKTNEVIAEFPPKKIQDMIAKMWELAGVFVDKKA